MTSARTTNAHPITHDQPLPGFYPCLTLQLNVTRYQSEALGRMVLVVREPSDGIEIAREILPQAPWGDIADRTAVILRSALRDMQYLQEGNRND